MCIRDRVKDGLIDSFSFAAGVPISAFSQIAAENPVNIFGFTEEQRAKILEAMPEVSAYDIPSDLYPGAPSHGTVAMWNFATASAEMPDSLAYEITKMVMENNDAMVQIHAAAAETLAENAVKNTFLPYHPGAVRYFDEAGIEIPAELRN